MRTVLSSRAGRRARTRARDETFLLDAVQSLLEAGRRSGGAVLASLDRTLRGIDPAIDSVLVFAPSGDELACVYSGGLRAEHFRRLRLRRGVGAQLPVRAADSGRRAVYPGDGDPLMPNDRDALAMPIGDGRRLLGVVYVSSVRAGADRATRESLVRAIEQAAMPYAIALEREADRTEATHDGLTGLLAPRAFRRQLHAEFARAGRLHDPMLSLWFVDTDSFKAINDRFGHRAGDAVLQGIASLLLLRLDPELDLAARNGGDEFCALIRGATKSVAIERAAEFCAAVRRHDFGVGVPVTASIGVATYPYDASSSSGLLEAADAAMYHSKRNGRNCISFAVERGGFASLRAEAGEPSSRSSSQWRSTVGGSCARPSS